MNRFVPKDKRQCWLANPASISMAEEVTFWATGMWHVEMLKRGLLFATRKQAVTAAKEMIDHVPNDPADLPAVAGKVRRDVRPRFVVVSDGLEASVHDLEIRRDLFPTLTGNRKDACDGCGLGTAHMIAVALNFYEANAPGQPRLADTTKEDDHV